MTKPGPKPKIYDQAVLDFIIRYKQENQGNTPDYRTIADGVGLASTGTVGYHIKKLIRAGKIRRTGAYNRHMEVVGAAWHPPLDHLVESAVSRCADLARIMLAVCEYHNGALEDRTPGDRQ